MRSTSGSATRAQRNSTSTRRKTSRSGRSGSRSSTAWGSGSRLTVNLEPLPHAVELLLPLRPDLEVFLLVEVEFLCARVAEPLVDLIARIAAPARRRHPHRVPRVVAVAEDADAVRSAVDH